MAIEDRHWLMLLLTDIFDKLFDGFLLTLGGILALLLASWLGISPLK